MTYPAAARAPHRAADLLLFCLTIQSSLCTNATTDRVVDPLYKDSSALILVTGMSLSTSRYRSISQKSLLHAVDELCCRRVDVNGNKGRDVVQHVGVSDHPDPAAVPAKIMHTLTQDYRNTLPILSTVRVPDVSMLLMYKGSSPAFAALILPKSYLRP